MTTENTRQDPTDAARRSAKAIHDLGAAFMIDSKTYAAGAAAGYQGLAFYFGGRAGVMGDVGSDQVTEAFMFFPKETVNIGWVAAAEVEGREASAERFAGAAHAWAEAHLPDGAIDYGRLAELAGKVVRAADPEDAPIFTGWRELPLPTDARALAVHHINALRELRGAKHIAAVRAKGLGAYEAFMIREPQMAGIFGWSAPDSDPTDEDRALWQEAEDLTDELFGAELAVLDEDELAEFCDLVNVAFEAII